MKIRKDPGADLYQRTPSESGPRGAARAVAPWAHRPPGGTGLEDRAAGLFRRAAAPVAFNPQARHRVRERLEADLAGVAGRPGTSPRPPGRRKRVLAPALHWGIAAGLLLGSGVVIAARGVDHWWKLGPRAARSPGATSSKTAPTRRGLRSLKRPEAVAGAVVAASATTEPAVAPTIAPAVAEPSPLLDPARSGPPAVNSSPPPPRARAETGATATVVESQLSIEARLLNGAISQLRQHRDAAGALAGLDQYLSRFPNGTLAAEATTARVDALLMLGRKTEALAALSALPLEGGGREQELRVIRGELRATSDCARAISDFDQILSMTAPPALVERALYGRAVCWSRQGERGEARRDAGRYLARFPGGRFAGDARRLVAGDDGAQSRREPAGLLPGSIP